MSGIGKLSSLNRASGDRFSRARFSGDRTRKAALIAAVLGAATFGARNASATTPGVRFDLRVDGTGLTDVTVANPGDTFTLDLYCTVTGADSDLTNDSIIDVFSAFKTSNGGLIGDLIGLNPPAPFNQLSSSPGQQSDIDGDGDFDIGSTSSTDPNVYYFSRAGSTPIVTGSSGVLIGQVRFTAVQLAGASTQISWFTPPAGALGHSIFGNIDGIGYDTDSSGVTFGGPVTVHAAQVFDPGTPTYLNGTQSTHLNVSGTIKQGSGSTLIVDGGISLPGGSLFDMRDSSGHYNGQEIRVNDSTSGNSGGAAFVNSMVVGRTSSGVFTQSAGYTQIAGAMTLGAASGSDGSLVVSGGSMHAGTLKVGGGGNGFVSQTGGFFTATNLDMNLASGVTGSVDVTGGVFTMGNGTVGGGAGSATLHVHDGGQIAVNGKLNVMSDGAGHAGQVLITSGGVLQAANLVMYAGSSIDQTGGTANISALGLSADSNGSLASRTYTLTDGNLNAGGIVAGGKDLVGEFIQNGGTIVASGGIIVGDHWVLNNGQTSSDRFNIFAPNSNARGLLEQTGGYLSTNHLVVAGTYRVTGGSFTVNQDVEIQGNGTIDFANSPAAFAAGANSIIQLPTTALGNTGNAALKGAAGSLINYPAGYNPAAHFASVSTDGLLHEDGTALTIPHGKSITGAASIVGNVTNHGSVSPGYGLGELDADGDYSQASDGVLNIDIGEGSSGATSDLLSLTGNASLAGALQIELLNGFKPAADDAFTILSAASLSGAFANAQSQINFDGGRFDVTYDGQSVTLSNFVATPEPGSVLMSAVASVALLARRRRA